MEYQILKMNYFVVGTNDTEATTAFYKALALGGSLEGEPGQRGPRFSAYERDLDNNKICFSE